MQGDGELPFSGKVLTIHSEGQPCTEKASHVPCSLLLLPCVVQCPSLCDMPPRESKTRGQGILTAQASFWWFTGSFISDTAWAF